MSITTKSPKKEITGFDDAVMVKQIDGSDTLFSGYVPWDWCGVWAAHGGYVSALIHSAARTYFTTIHPKRNQPDPINVYIQFLHPVREGPIRFVFRLLKEASRISVVQIELQTNSPKTDTFKTCVIAIIAQGNLSTESGLTIKTTPTLPRCLIPDREKDCEVYQLLPIAYEVAPVVMKFKSVRVKGAKDSMFNDRYGRTVKEIWVTRTDGAGWCVLSLGQLVDAFDGAPGNYSPDNTHFFQGARYPTLSMATEIKKDPKGAEWLFLRIKTHKIKNGRFDTDIWVLDEEGDLVALSKHVSLTLLGELAEQPEKLKKIFKL